MDFDNVKPTNKLAEGVAGYTGFGSAAASAEPEPETTETVTPEETVTPKIDAVPETTAEEAVQAGVEDGVQSETDFGPDSADVTATDEVEYEASESELAAEMGLATGLEDDSDAVGDEPDFDEVEAAGDEDDHDLPETDVEAAEPKGQEAVDSYVFDRDPYEIRRAREKALDSAIGHHGHLGETTEVLETARAFHKFIIGEAE